MTEIAETPSCSAFVERLTDPLLQRVVLLVGLTFAMLLPVTDRRT